MLFNNKTVINSFIMFLAGSAITANAQQEATAPEDSDVIRLTTETFPDFIKENSLVLAEFFAPWCGHCKNLAPEYVSAASELKKYDIPLAQIDCTVESDLCMEHGIKGYPSLKIFRGVDLPPSDYEGARNKDSIINYMKKQALPSVQVVEDEQDLKDLISEATEVVIVDTGVENLNETFHKAANLYRDYFTFLQQSPSNNTEKGVLSLYHPGSNNSDPIVFTGKNTTLDHIVEWISIESKPYFGEVDGSTFESYMDSGIPLAYFFYTTPEERESYSELFTTLGKEYRGKINFAALDASKYGRHATNLNMKEQFPLFVIHDINTNYKYGLEQLSDEEFANLKKEESRCYCS
ncbi:related to Protein disulfide-isomerase [Saccharomycodes ludwigii]|uniref:protein disulfide-isomerase n=1 Tax=Saccharomycodes ludwigii TaxID=36035 RepID=A0A376BCA1_9ASCO|nr:related to Protein disulfide-isomerase [Saccharomycodes ludwigii]